MRASTAARCKLLTRTGLDWTHKYPAIAEAVVVARRPPGLSRRRTVRRAAPTASPRSASIQLASDSGNAAALVFFLFDLLYLDGEDLGPRPLIERKARLAALLSNASSPLHYSDHQIGQGRGVP